MEIHGRGTTPDFFDRMTGFRALAVREGFVPALPNAVDDWMRRWVEAGGAFDGPHETALPPDTLVRRWRGDSPMADVDLYVVRGGGHTWPGSRLTLPRALLGRTSRTFDATTVAWRFLAAHAREPHPPHPPVAPGS